MAGVFIEREVVLLDVGFDQFNAGVAYTHDVLGDVHACTAEAILCAVKVLLWIRECVVSRRVV